MVTNLYFFIAVKIMSHWSLLNEKIVCAPFIYRLYAISLTFCAVIFYFGKPIISNITLFILLDSEFRIYESHHSSTNPKTLGIVLELGSKPEWEDNLSCPDWVSNPRSLDYSIRRINHRATGTIFLPTYLFY